MIQAFLKIALAAVLIAASFGGLLSAPENIAFAVEDPLSVSWETSPLFSATNFAPGDTITKRLQITNSSDTTRYAVYWGAVGKTLKKGLDNGDLSDKLLVSIRDDEGTVLLSQIGLADLIKKSGESGCANVGQMSTECSSALELIVEPNQTKVVLADIHFAETAANEYQGAQVGFDVAAGFNEAGTVLAAETGEVLGVKTGVNLIYSVLASLAMFLLGLYLRRRSTAEQIA